MLTIGSDKLLENDFNIQFISDIPVIRSGSENKNENGVEKVHLHQHLQHLQPLPPDQPADQQEEEHSAETQGWSVGLVSGVHGVGSSHNIPSYDCS